MNLYKHIGVLKFEDLVKQNLLNESEKREFSEYYFKNKIEVSEPLINNIDGTIIYQKENWFNVKTGQGDLISVLASTTQVINEEMKKAGNISEELSKKKRL